MGFIRKAFDQDLAANESYTIALAGDYVRVVASTGEVEVRTDQGDVLNLQQGMGVHRPGRRWSSLTLTDKSGATNSVELVIGDGVVLDDNRTSINGTVTVQGNTGSADDAVLALPGGGNYLQDAVDATMTASTATLIIAGLSADAGRWIQSDPANSSEVRIGNNTLTGSRGIALQPGESVYVPSLGAVYGWTSGTGQVMRVTRVIQ